ncbi:DUF692 domain-containing protein [Leeia sp. TBRC 13508]|uniref:DUF692 domain-containing protein n=1 Tax=Leeia speluncae TaxID=2884804 RepID=A0ABS8D508_9NEIS|nr:DUF692 domain-containing protein [Leeia speluncae]MCB6183309.1 DUF692 domain-containing protein [Leeia speluncae]
MNNLTHLPVAAGLGLRHPFVKEVWQKKPKVAWWEVHSENYFDGGANLATLKALRAHYPISLHGVGMGIGSAVPLDQTHLNRLADLVNVIGPNQVSEHLCWNRTEKGAIPDLLPVPYTQAMIDWIVDHVDQVQNKLKRQILLENVSAYLAFEGNEMTEADMLAQIVQRSGCGILLDVNNIYVNSVNLGVSADAFLAAMPAGSVKEIHIAGHSEEDGFLLDTHDHPVIPPVWALLEKAYQYVGPVPTLLERDGNIPVLDELLLEVATAEEILGKVKREKGMS